MLLRVLRQFSQCHLAFEDLLAKLAVPAGITAGDAFIQLALFEHFRCDFQRQRHRVHRADMTIEQIIFIGALTAHFGVKVQPAGRETTCFEDFIHHQGVLFDAVRELIGIPAELRVAAVCIHRTEQTERNGAGNFMVERVACKGSVVRLNVKLNLFLKAELFQKAIHGRCVIVILMFGRFLRFRLDEQRTAKTGFMFMLDHHLHKAAKLFTLLAQIGIEQRFVAFTPAPQHIVFTAQLMRRVHGGDHLRGCPGEDFRVWVGGGACAVARMGKAVGGAPQQLHAALLLLLRQHFDHLGKVIQVLLQRRAFRRYVNIMEAVVRHVELMEKLKGHVGFAFREAQRVACLLPRAFKRANTKHIRAVPAERVPVAGSETQMVFHTLAGNQLIGIVMAKCQGIRGFRAFITHTFKLVEISRHN